jgi:hypothetical protein
MKKLIKFTALVLLLLPCSLAASDEPAPSISYKIETMKIEKIELKNIKLSAAIELIKSLSKKADPEGNGINISFIAPKDEKNRRLDPVINDISLTNVPVKDVLRYVCEATGMTFRAVKFSVMVYPKNMDGDKMETRTFKIRPDTINSIEKK